VYRNRQRRGPFSLFRRRRNRSLCLNPFVAPPEKGKSNLVPYNAIDVPLLTELGTAAQHPLRNPISATAGPFGRAPRRADCNRDGPPPFVGVRPRRFHLRLPVSIR